MKTLAKVDAVMRLARARAALRDSGAVPGRPSWVDDATEQKDRESVAGMACGNDACHQQGGIRYEAWTRESEYIGVAVCPVCGWSEEV